MEDIYIFNHDCIQCMMNFQYVNVRHYVNFISFNKLFYTSSLYIDAKNYTNVMKQLNILQSSHDYKITKLTSIRIKCKFFPGDRKQHKYIWTHFTNLQRLYFVIYDSTRCAEMRYYPISTHLTHLKIKNISNIMEFSPVDINSFRYLKLHNVFTSCKTEFLKTSTKLESLTRTFSEDVYIYIKLGHQYNRNLTYLKISNVKWVFLSGMTQLKCKILNNVEILQED